VHHSLMYLKIGDQPGIMGQVRVSRIERGPAAAASSPSAYSGSPRNSLAASSRSRAACRAELVPFPNPGGGLAAISSSRSAYSSMPAALRRR
jgi:hypothetical protein